MFTKGFDGWVRSGLFVLVSLIACLAIGCPPATDDDDDTTTGDDDDTVSLEDEDGDGFSPAEGDCDDTNPDVNPLAPEVCDGLDNDCDDSIDEPFDADGDGATTCGPDGIEGNEDDDCDDGDADLNQLDQDGDGVTTCGGDCEDDNADVHPGADEGCDDIDTDCDGSLGPDEIDDDFDGFTECEADCDDTNADTYSGAPELCDGLDNNCDNTVPDDEADNDGDGMWGCDGDCDDADATVYDGAPELCDTLDNDCNGTADDIDVDLDGYIDADCGGDDCDDAEATVNPGAEELCDQLDTDCDGYIPDNVDDDGDGYTFCDDDCDDADPNVNPGMEEIFGIGIDDDCNGMVDVIWDQAGELSDLTVFHGDALDPSFSGPQDLDMDGDGVDDLLITALDDDAPNVPVNYFYSGRDPWPAEVDHTMADGEIEGETGETTFPCTAVGDVNDDGYEDVFCAVGDDYCLFEGSATPWPVGTDYTDYSECISPDPADAGYELFGVGDAGDLDDDGIDDVVFYYGDVIQVNSEDFEQTRALHIFYGQANWTSELVTASDADIDTYAASTYLARVNAADVDGDGYQDVMICQGSITVGTPTMSSLFYGGVGAWTAGMDPVNADATFRGDLTDGTGFSECARFAGDIDGDGNEDLHFEAYDDGDRFLFGTGARWSGLNLMSNYDFELTVTNMYEKLTFAQFLDFNNDGYGDVVLGLAYTFDYLGYANVYLGRAGLSGSELWSTAPIRFGGDGIDLPWGGSSAYGVGDVTGDGATDLIIGSTYTWTDQTGYWYLAPGYTGPDPGATDDDGDGYSEQQGDCDDTDPNVYPGANEPLDFIDWDCDGVIYDPGVNWANMSADLTYSGNAITGTWTYNYLEEYNPSEIIVCTHTFDVTGTITTGNYDTDCPDCEEQWDMVFTDAGHNCIFEAEVLGALEHLTEDYAVLYAADVVPYGYCVGDDCQLFDPYLFDDYLDYWITTYNAAIWIWGSDLMEVGHPEFVGYLVPDTGGSTLPLNGDYTFDSMWVFSF